MRSEKPEKTVTATLALTFTSVVSENKTSENIPKFDQTGRKIESRFCTSRELQNILNEMEAKGVVF